MFLMMGWIMALLLWVMKDSRPIPQILSLQTDRNRQLDNARLWEVRPSRRTYWLMRNGDLQLKTTDRDAISVWLRQYGSSNVKILMTDEPEEDGSSEN